MTTKKQENQLVEVNFESHPPIESDLDAISNFLSKLLLHFADYQTLARHLINLEDVTQIVAIPDQEGEDDSDEDEQSDDIFGVVSVIQLDSGVKGCTSESAAIGGLTKFIIDKCSAVKELIQKNNKVKIGFIVNERYANLPPQLALPTFKHLTGYLNKSKFDHLVFISKILLNNSKKECSEPPTKRSKSTVVFINAEEEILFEHACAYHDIDVSSFCDTEIEVKDESKYTPFRRIVLLEYDKWPLIMNNLDKELKL